MSRYGCSWTAASASWFARSSDNRVPTSAPAQLARSTTGAAANAALHHRRIEIIAPLLDFYTGKPAPEPKADMPSQMRPSKEKGVAKIEKEAVLKTSRNALSASSVCLVKFLMS
jgi:hypothetical protein